MLKIENGDYRADERGRLQRLQGDEALLQRVLFRLTARRGGLVFMPQLGSELYRLGNAKPQQRRVLALQYVTQALEEEPVTVEDVQVTAAGGDRMQVRVFLKKDRKSWSLAVTV